MVSSPNCREELLLQKLLVCKRLSAQEAMDLLNVSKSTIRRIFIDMENRGTVIRAHGGIQLTSSIRYSFNDSKTRYSAEKIRIGKAACNLLSEDDVIFIDAGTTSMYFAVQLIQMLSNNSISVKSIFTNSVALLDIFPANINIGLIGGVYRPERKDLYGYLATLAVGHLHFSKCFLGTDGIINDCGFGAIDSSTAEMNLRLLDSASERIVLCDHSKFQNSCHVAWASFSEINTVITDTDAKNEDIKKLQAYGCNVILA